MRLLASTVTLALLCCLACSSSETGDAACQPPPDANDGKVHPPPSGETMTEAEACDALLDAFENRRKTMMPLCTTTGRTCPNHVRILTGAQDATYDRGSVEGCAAHYDSQTSCSTLTASLDTCVPATHPLPQPAAPCP